ncbi:hypothetical protein [Microbacterium protaetiae]|uniref:hypothetical protein n=1 Tax=Microbacterium protaetiae TaxID=2509458 RepID=UPI001F5C6033|nr:hypothetical protein [Microbacterium protaetiae]
MVAVGAEAAFVAAAAEAVRAEFLVEASAASGFWTAAAEVASTTPEVRIAAAPNAMIRQLKRGRVA